MNPFRKGSKWKTILQHATSFKSRQKDNEYSMRSTRQAILLFSKALSDKTHFSEQEVIILITIYFHLRDPKLLYITPRILRHFLFTHFHVQHKLALEGFVRGFVRGNTSIGAIGISDFVHGMSILLRGSLLERAKFTFFIYDQDMDGFLRKDVEFYNNLGEIMNTKANHTTHELNSEESYRELRSFLLGKFDKNKLGKVSYDQYLQIVLKDPLFMECLFSIWPDQKYVNLFQNVFFLPTKQAYISYL